MESQLSNSPLSDQGDRSNNSMTESNQPIIRPDHITFGSQLKVTRSTGQTVDAIVTSMKPIEAYNATDRYIPPSVIDIEGQIFSKPPIVYLSDVDNWIFFVHFTIFNKRLDQWVQSNQLDLSSIQAPKPDSGFGHAGKKAKKSHKSKKSKKSKSSKTKKKSTKSSKITNSNDSDTNSSKNSEGNIDKEALEAELSRIQRTRTVNQIFFGDFKMDAWYFSPFPGISIPCDKLLVCEYCLSYFDYERSFQRHISKCHHRHPPGDEIYRNGNNSVFEVDGSKNRAFCQKLCLLCKLFLDHKALQSDVDVFLFYVLTENNSKGCHIVGYFSKEKGVSPSHNNNLSCILTLPCHQRKGYGKFLIAFSYELSIKEQRAGTPETPLSDLGLLSYRAYWTETLLNYFKEHNYSGSFSIEDISTATRMVSSDIRKTLQYLGVLRYDQGQYFIAITPALIEKHNKILAKPKIHIERSRIHWSPIVENTQDRLKMNIHQEIGSEIAKSN